MGANRGERLRRLVAFLCLGAAGGLPPPLPAAIKSSLPLGYVQSAFVAGDPNVRQSNGVSFLNATQRREQLRIFAAGASRGTFAGGEMFINTLETAAARADVRRMNTAILEVANETQTPPFLGLWIPARLPGFWWPANYSGQPQAYRARGLMSNGSEWVLYPTAQATGTSILNFHGSDLDITNEAAVDALMANLATVFRADCVPDDACVGPLVGSLLFSEAGLSPPYLADRLPPYGDSDNAQFGNLSDLQPPDEHGRPPLLRMGNASTLFTDGNVTFSFYQGPRRTIPLFSTHARDSFVRFAAARGVSTTTLPANRDEFNADESTVTLPGHVSFLDTTDTQTWAVYEDWVYATWFAYVNRTATTILEAQKGNPWFGGGLYFQLAGWYSIRARSREPTTYAYRDVDGGLRNETLTFADWDGYDGLNPLMQGQDLEQFLDNAPWLAGWVHEASHGVPILGIPPPPASIPAQHRADRDRYFMADKQYRRFVVGQGTMARELCRARGKLFGLFARAAFISDPTFHGPSVADTLTAPAFDQTWNYTAALLDPDLVCSLSTPRFCPTPQAPLADPPLAKAFHNGFSRLPRQLSCPSCL